MLRFSLALVALLALAVAARAADPPAGTWVVNVDGARGELVIKDVKGGTVAGTLFETDFTGTWNGKLLAFKAGDASYEAHLVSEPGEKDKAKYTLTGTRVQTARGAPELIKTGWYAQILSLIHI